MYSKGNHKQNEKTTYRMRENICKQSDWPGINLQNIQTAHAAQYIKKKIKKCSQDLNRHFSKEDKQMVKKHIERCSASLIIESIETTMWHHITSIRMAIIKNCINTKCWRGCGEKGTLSVDGNINWYNHYGKQLEIL